MRYNCNKNCSHLKQGGEVAAAVWNPMMHSHTCLSSPLIPWRGIYKKFPDGDL